MQNQKHVLALMVVLPLLVAVAIFAGMNAQTETTRNIMAGLSMVGLAALQLLVGILLFGSNGLLNGFDLVKKGSSN